MADNPFAQYATQPAAAANPFSQFAATPTSSEIPGARQSFVGALGEAVTSIPESALKQAVGLVNMVTSPLQTAGGALDLAAGVVQKVLPQPVVDFVNSLHNPEAAKRAVDLANHVGGQFKTNFGTLDGFKHYLATDPVGLVGDISMLLSGGATLAAKTAAVASKAPAAVLSGLMQGGRVANIAEAAAPVMAAARPVANALNKAVPVLNQMSNFTNPVSLFVNPITAQGANITGKAATSLAKGAYNAVEPYIPGGGAAIKARAYMAALSNDPAKINAAITMLEKGMPIEEVASTLQSSGLASLANTAQNASTVVKDLYLARANAVKQEQANKLAGAKTNVNALQQGNLPVSTEPANLPRTALNATLTAEQATLAQQQAARAQQLAKVEADLAEKAATLESGLKAENIASQQKHGVADPNQPIIGDIISKEAKDARGAAKVVNKQLYDKAFTLAGDAKVNAESLVAKAEEILGKPLSQFDPQTAHPIISQLLKLKNEAPPIPATGGGGFLAPLTSRKPQAAPPATATLEDLDAIRSAINSAVRDAKVSPNVDPKLRNLSQLQDVITKLVKDSGAITPEAKAAYATAVDQYKNNYVPKFKTGVQENLFRRTNVSENKIKPEDVTNAFFKGESEAKQFVSMLGENPTATQALKSGIEGLYFSQVAKGGLINTAAHANFMHTNRKVLDILDQTGMGIRNRLESLGNTAIAKESEFAGIPSKVANVFAPEVANLTAAKTAEKARVTTENAALNKISTQLGHENTIDLRKSLVGNEAVMNKALARMPEPAKAALARGVMEDALAQGNGNQILKHLNDNETTILSALKAANPKMGATIFADAKKGAEVQALIEETAKKVSATPAESAQHLADLTQDLPAVRKVVDQVKTELAHEENFKKLAQEGQRAGGGAYGLASEAAGKPIASLSHAMTIYNVITNRLKGGLDKKLTAEIANELISSPEAAAAIARAQAKTQGKIEAATAPTMLNRLKAVDYSALKPSRRTVLNVNQLVPNEETRNSLNTYSMIP